MSNKQEIIRIFVETGFTAEEAESQLSKLAEIINAAVVEQMVSDYPETEITEQGIAAVVSEKYTTDDAKAELANVIAVEAQGYLDAITEGMIPLKKQKLVAALASISLEDLS